MSNPPCTSTSPTPQILLVRTALDLSIPQHVLIVGVALTQVLHLALGLFELFEIPLGPLLELAPLNGIPSFRCVNYTAQLGFICNLLRVHLIPSRMNSILVCH